MFGDLHFHSTNSDGIVTPEDRILQIQSLDPENQGIWALTDHDTFSSDFVIEARERGIETLWATEISARSEALGISLHMTYYAPKLSIGFETLVNSIVTGRKNKIIRQIEQLKMRGFPIDVSGFYQWIASLGMSTDMASNWHVASYLWRDGASATESLELARSLTSGKVVDKVSFMKECLRATGDFAHIGYALAPPYEPSLSELSHMARGEGALLSIAHPNFSLGKTLSRLGAGSREDRYPIFRDIIAPAIVDEGVNNFEINALASPPWVEAIERVTRRAKGIITYGSDNHGLTTPDDKHGLIGRQNPLLTEEMVVNVRRRFEEMVEA